MEGMTCGQIGHVMGCPGNAGGDHELRPYTDEERLNVGRWVLREHILSDDTPANNQESAIKALEEEGFEASFIQDPQIDDRLWLELDRWDDKKKLDEFILEFAGWDASIVSLFNLVESKEVP